MSMRVGLAGISGLGGGEALRFVAGHQSLELAYAAGRGSSGGKLSENFPSLSGKYAKVVIEKWHPNTLPVLDLLFASLPTGSLAEALAKVPKNVKAVDNGSDHRYVDGWTRGLADIWPEDIDGKSRLANPGCFPVVSTGI